MCMCVFDGGYEEKEYTNDFQMWEILFFAQKAQRITFPVLEHKTK